VQTLVLRLGHSARRAGFRAVAAGRWLTDLVLQLAPRIPARDRATLRAQFPGRTDSQIADTLVATAVKASAAVGAAVGGLAAVEFAAPPTLLAAPVQVTAETLCVVGIELKLVAELHEIAGLPAPGTAAERAAAYVSAWVRRRALEPAAAGQGLAAVLGAAGRREVRGVLMRRLGRSTGSMAPFLVGAAAGAELNRRATRALADRLLTDLRPSLSGNDPSVITQ
jgi:hypothetical protein